MLKLGPGESERGRWCQRLGEQVCAVVHVVMDTTDGYVMEQLDDVVPYPALLRDMEQILATHVWSQPAMQIQLTFLDELAKRIRILPPPPCLSGYTLTHGDCTVSNAMKRGEQLLIVDPLPQWGRHHVDSVPETDMARLLQSAMGWEIVAYGDDTVEYWPPEFWFNASQRRLALWWCAATCKRIRAGGGQAQQPEHRIQEWCHSVEEACLALVSI